MNRFLICPVTRREIVVVPVDNTVQCPECGKTHLLPDGESHSMQWYLENNMCEESF